MLTLGLFSIGLDTYWPQFDGLRERLLGYQERIAEKLRTPHLVNAGMVDTPERAREAADQFHREGVDLIVLFVSTYALSHTVLPVAQRGGAPVLILNLQPVAAIDYAQAERHGRPRPHDRRMAGTLPGLCGPRDQLRVPAGGGTGAPGDRLPGGRGSLDRDHRVRGRRPRKAGTS